MSDGNLTKLARALLLTLCLAALGGCSLIRVGYSHLDTFAEWTADDYFDLDAQQKQEFRSRFGRLHEWHRYEQLPDYSAFLTETKARVQKGLAREDVLWIIGNTSTRYRTLVGHVAYDAAALLMTVTPAQLESLQRQWGKDNRRFVRDHRLEESAEEQRRAAAQRALERVRGWTGSLSDEQEERITALAREMPMNQRLRHEDRQRRQREFLLLMAQRGNAAGFPAQLRHWLANWEKGRAREYERVWAPWMEKQADFYVAVDRMLTPQQREHVAHRLQNFASDFTRLAQRPAAQAAADR